MKDILEELALVLVFVVCVGSCSLHYAGKADRKITQMVAEAMEVNRGNHR